MGENELLVLALAIFQMGSAAPKIGTKMSLVPQKGKTAVPNH